MLPTYRSHTTVRPSFSQLDDLRGVLGPIGDVQQRLGEVAAGLLVRPPDLVPDPGIGRLGGQLDPASERFQSIGEHPGRWCSYRSRRCPRRRRTVRTASGWRASRCLIMESSAARVAPVLVLIGPPADREQDSHFPSFGVRPQPGQVARELPSETQVAEHQLLGRVDLVDPPHGGVAGRFL